MDQRIRATLLTEAEAQKYDEQIAQVEQQWKSKGCDYEQYRAEADAIRRARLLAIVKKVQARPDDFIDALLAIVGSRGESYYALEQVFTAPDDAFREAVVRGNTPEGRRVLYTMLRALTEVPNTWAKSAFCRFLRGVGKQRGAKYHGAGMLGVAYGWKEKEVSAFCRVICDSYSLYSQVLMSYADVEEEMREADPEFEVIDHEATYKATRVERDVQFLQKLCDILDRRGLAEVPVPNEPKAKKERKAKQFRSGDVVAQATARDLPLPAHLRLEVETSEGKEEWKRITIEIVVVRANDATNFDCLMVGPDGKAYSVGNIPRRPWQLRKDFLAGAIYLGPFNGETVPPDKKSIRANVRYRKAE